MIKDFFKEYINLISSQQNLYISPQISEYIASIFENFYKNMPLYLIDVYEQKPFQTYKKRGDLALILVGFFTEWLNRSRRPIKEEDYIISGKQNYFNAYVYLDSNFGEHFYSEYQKNYVYILKQYEDVYSYIEIFKMLSENFEEYANMLKSMRKSIKETEKIYKMFKNIEEFLDRNE